MINNPTLQDLERARKVVASLVEFTEANKVIRVGDPLFLGVLADYRYSFEGEDDLLHLTVERLDSGPLSVEEAQQVCGYVLPDLAPGVIWVKPGTVSQHFYLAHDELLRQI